MFLRVGLDTFFRVQQVFRDFGANLNVLHFQNSRAAHLAILGGVGLSVMWDYFEGIFGLTGFTLIDVLGRPGGGKTKIIQDPQQFILMS